jgi:hypothetical protein
MSAGNTAPAVRELARMSEDIAVAVRLLGAYERGDRRAVLAVWDALGRAGERLEAACDHVRCLRSE